MKKLMVAVLAAASMFANAAEKAEEAELQQNKAPIFWGFVSSGIYSGYKLYGSLVNSEPTWQTYMEGNVNLNFNDVDLGYIGIGIWSNSDLTDKRRDVRLGRMFNEWDFNIHWDKTFWFDDNKTWGLDARTFVVWYYYPPCNYHGYNSANHTSFDWDFSFALINPYVIPFVTIVHEYKLSDGNLIQFGLKRDCPVTDDFSLTPSIAFVWRNSNYNWCFPTAGWSCMNGSGLATMDIGLDANYKITDNFGLFAKFSFCSTLDSGLRDAADAGTGCDYGKYKDFVWGGVGVNFSF